MLSTQAAANGSRKIVGIPMKNLNSKLLRKFLELASIELKGKWLLVGGTLLPAVGIDVRATVDIDLVGLGVKEKMQNLELMTLAERLGLHIEAINQAAEFFVSRHAPTSKDMFILVKGKRAQIFRPSVELYWKLKVPRLTESDLLDCQHYLQFCIGQKDGVDVRDLDRVVQLELKKENSSEKRDRLLKLSELVSFRK